MTRTDTSADFDKTDEDDATGLGAIVRVALFGLVATMAGGALVGFAAAVVDGGVKRPVVAAIIGAAFLAIFLLAGRSFLRRIRALSLAPAGPRTTKARGAMLASGILGGALGVVLVVAGDDTRGLFTNAALDPRFAIAGIAIWCVATPLLSLFWWRNIDEHEAQSYRSGAVVALTAYAAIAPGWWLAWRGGFAPQPVEMMTFLAVMVVWGVGWAWNRFR